MTDQSKELKLLLEENSRLRGILEQQKDDMIADLKQRLAQAQASAEHYRNEAQRNADIGKQIAAEAQRKEIEYKAKIEAYEQRTTTSGRPEYNR